MNNTTTPLARLNHTTDARPIDVRLAAVRVRGFTAEERAEAERAIREDDGRDAERFDLCS